MIAQQNVGDSAFIQYDHPAHNNNRTPSRLTIIDFDIWNFISVMSAVYDSMSFTLMRRIVFIWRSMTS